jgi:hypothetical protein
MKSIFHDCLVTVELIEEAGDNGAYTGSGVDMQDYEGVAFVLVTANTEAGAYTLKAQQDSDSAFGTAADLLGTSTALTSSGSLNKVGVLDIKTPQEQYVRSIVTVPNLTSAQGVAVIAIRYGAKKLPVSNTGEYHVSPAEGTA